MKNDLFTYNHLIQMGNQKIYIHCSLIQNLGGEDYLTLKNDKLIIYVPKSMCKYIYIKDNQLSFDNISPDEFIEVNSNNDVEYI